MQNDEPDETIVVQLSNAPAGTTISTPTGTGTITDDDTPTFSIDSPSVTEGDSGSVDMTFTVTLSPASYRDVTVDYADAGSGTATSGTDYTAIAAGMLTFDVGDTSKTVTVVVAGDVEEESDETIVVQLSNAPDGTRISTEGGTRHNHQRRLVEQQSGQPGAVGGQPESRIFPLPPEL